MYEVHAYIIKNYSVSFAVLAVAKIVAQFIVLNNGVAMCSLQPVIWHLTTLCGQEDGVGHWSVVRTIRADARVRGRKWKYCQKLKSLDYIFVADCVCVMSTTVTSLAQKATQFVEIK